LAVIRVDVPGLPGDSDPAQRGRTLVAVILASSVACGLVFFTLAVLWDALKSPSPGLSENATQVLSGAFGGIIGALAVYLGGRGSRRPDQ
jgi:hypothetical protein